MERDIFWKNFNLGTELSIAGAFIYDGLKIFDELENFYNEDDIFTFMYNVAVGIERLEKVAIVLIEHENTMDSEEFEKSMITHNHLMLLDRIKSKHAVKLGVSHNQFLQILGKFYKTMRYDRYSLREAHEYDKEKKALQ